MTIDEKYNLWQKKACEDPNLIQELKNLHEKDEIHNRFFCNLNFGTAGLRGIMGAGPNRMNIYTVRHASQGLANYLNKNYKNPSVAIAFDSRINSELFAQEAARVLCANGISVFFNRELQPTPVLSFCVREFCNQAGIMITASHNSAEYNGYKCYGPDGSQISGASAELIYSEIQKIDIFNDIKICNFHELEKSGKFKIVENYIYKKYLSCIREQSINSVGENCSLSVVYTPLNGTGTKLVKEILSASGITKVMVVPEQEMPDGNFPTCPCPNPELKDALALALQLAKKTLPDIILATDPDCDRVGVAYRSKGEFRIMTGNEVGVLLLHYILSSRQQKGTLPARPIMVKSIVSSKLADAVAKEYLCEVKNVLTGFKYIGEQILHLEKCDELERFVFGFEESCGYLAGTYVRDKDAVVASMLICEMAAHYKTQGKTLGQVLEEIYQKYGRHTQHTFSFEFNGPEGLNKMRAIMRTLREGNFAAVGGIRVLGRTDYLSSEASPFLPKADMLTFALEGAISVIIRPSGTEPRLKIYIHSRLD
jgi:phosphoglucomutase